MGGGKFYNIGPGVIVIKLFLLQLMNFGFVPHKLFQPILTNALPSDKKFINYGQKCFITLPLVPLL
jgi:hypothetical protein